MKLYVAHNWAARGFLRNIIVPVIEKLGHSVTSRWISIDHDHEGPVIEAIKDVNDVMAADAILLFADQFGTTPGRGKYVELGYALALDKRVFVIGDADDCVFYKLERVKRIQTLEEIQ